MTSTRIDIPAERREKLCTILNTWLAGALDLSLATKQAHWNVKGATFRELHELFDMLHTNVELHVDEIAERCTALAGTAKGTLQAATSTTALPAFPIDAKDGQALLNALADRYAAFGKGVRAAIDETDGLGDKVTADLFTGVARVVDKDLWLIESHLNR
jgi:starvation-inducible DNA-binding protein